MEDQSLSSTEPSILLWAAVVFVVVLGTRAYLEYLRRVHHIGPVRGWREAALGGLALGAAVWSAMLIGVASQGLQFEIGYHPVRIFGTLALTIGVSAGVVALVTRLRGLLWQLIGACILAALGIATQVGVIWSLGAEPGIKWRPDLLVIGGLILLSGQFLGLRLVLGVARGKAGDTRLRRLLTALLMSVALLASQELVLLSADLAHQVVSSYARLVPEVALSLLSAVGVPIMLVVMLVDQRLQRRARQAQRRKHKTGFYESRLSEFAESRLDSSRDPRQAH